MDLYDEWGNCQYRDPDVVKDWIYFAWEWSLFNGFERVYIYTAHPDDHECQNDTAFEPVCNVDVYPNGRIDIDVEGLWGSLNDLGENHPELTVGRIMNMATDFLDKRPPHSKR